MKHVGLYFGSFNPLHCGHLMLAQYMLNTGRFNEVWLVVSPQNPFKQHADLASAAHRLSMARLGAQSVKGLKISDVEFSMPQPSYTIDTLELLQSQHANTQFSLIMGADNVSGLPKWKRAQDILSRYKIYVYPRKGFTFEGINPGHIEWLDGAPEVQVSSTQLRQWIASGLGIAGYVPNEVIEYIESEKLYK